MEGIGTTKNYMGRDNAGPKIIQGWEQLAKTTESKVGGSTLIVYSRAVKWWDDEVKYDISVRRKAHARYTSSNLRQDGRNMLLNRVQ